MNAHRHAHFWFRPDTPDEVKYSIFRRINTGGMTLNNHGNPERHGETEIRTFLRKLASDGSFRKTDGGPEQAMSGPGAALRFPSPFPRWITLRAARTT
jgi:hypothetical protein